MALVISVVYRGLAIPVAWRIRTGPWMPNLCTLLDCLEPAVPSDMTCDRGLQSPRLWATIRRQAGIPTCATTSTWPFRPRPDRAVAGLALRGREWAVHGDCRPRLPRTQASLHSDRDPWTWMPDQEAPWVVLTDEAPEAVDLGAYGMRVWIAQGFRSLKRMGMGWQWHRTRRLDSF